MWNCRLPHRSSGLSGTHSSTKPEPQEQTEVHKQAPAWTAALASGHLQPPGHTRIQQMTYLCLALNLRVCAWSGQGLCAVTLLAVGLAVLPFVPLSKWHATLPVYLAKDFGVLFDSSRSHIPLPLYEEILSSLWSIHIQNLVASHHLHHQEHAPSTTISEPISSVTS